MTGIPNNICPDISPDFDKYNVYNKYTDYENRTSFAVTVFKCNKEYNPDCKSDAEIEDILGHFSFTLYTL